MSNGKRQHPPQIPAQPQMQFSPEAIKSAKEMTCINEIPLEGKKGQFIQCGGQIFVEASRLKYISKIMSPMGKETIATVAIGKLCIACGKIFNPDEWMKLELEREKATKGTILDKDGKADG